MRRPEITDAMHEQANFGTPRQWSREQMAYIRDGYLNNLPMTAIATKLDCSTGAVTRILKIVGVETRPVGRAPVVTMEQRAEVSRLLQSYNQTKVALITGVGRFVVNRISMAEKQNGQQQVY